MLKPRALDLFCCAGGATKGLQRAGFHVTGVDIKPQPRYCGDAFIHSDSLSIPMEGFDFIWASPPCQGLWDSAILLCGTMFDLRVYRHRLFECSFQIGPPEHPKHVGSTGSHRGYSYGYPFVTIGGHNYNASDGKKAMGIDWMTRDELNEAIPPAYSEFIGRQFLEVAR